jgi:FkbM family methyltransferase
MELRGLLRNLRTRMRPSGVEALEEIEVEAVFGKILAFKRDLITRQILNFGAHTRPELAFLLSMIDAGDKVFDIGAHIGTFAIPIARKTRESGRVLAVEADRRIFDVLVENIAQNGLTHVVTMRNVLIAPAAAAFTATHVTDNTAATFFVADHRGKAVRHSTIDELTTDTFFPNLIKIDIEGMEAWALRNSSFIAEYKPIVYAEISESQLGRYGATIADLDRTFRELKYRLFRNTGERNAANDDFTVTELGSLTEGGTFFDVLAVPDTSPRLSRLTDKI